MSEKEQSSNTANGKKGVGYYFGFGEVLNYFFRKKSDNKTSNVNIKMMHGINKISIIMFLIAVLVIIARRIF